MAITISTHNGTRVARSHNLRIRETVAHEEHIDPRGHHEVWADIPLAKAYDILFGEAVKEYNKQQKRADRQIKSYLQTIKQDVKKHPVYEMIISVGSLKNPVDKELGRDIMLQFAKDWNERNPNLRMVGAYYHADEKGVPHVHIDYVPVAHGYTRGMNTQNGLVKALGEMGFKKSGRETAQIQWERRENQALERICRDRGLDVIHPQAGKDVKHLEKEQYIKSQDVNIYQEAIVQIKKATQKINQASITLKEGELPDWIKEKGVLKTSYIVEKEDLHHLSALLAADTLKNALIDIQRAYELASSRLLVSERECLTQEINTLRSERDILLDKCHTLEAEKDMAYKKVFTQDKELAHYRTFVEEHGLTNDYVWPSEDWGEHSRNKTWDIER